MPNHVTNIVTFKGSSEDVAKLMECLVIDDKVSFDGFAPMPSELENTTSPVRNESEAEIAESNRLKAEYGVDNWYDWAFINWGTKWGAYDGTVDGDSGVTFLTAWSTPLNALEKLSEKFPTVLIDVRYADEDTGSNVGTYSLQDGVLVDQYSPEVGTDSIRLAIEITGGSEYHLEDYWTEMCDEDVEGMSGGDDSYVDMVLPLIAESEIVNDGFPKLLLTKLRDVAVEADQNFYVAKLEEAIAKKD